MTRLNVSPIVFGLAALCVAGCGGDPNLVPVYPTTGTLTMGGEPFGPTLIHLRPMEEDGRMVVGTVDEQGKITFTTFKTGDGVPAGKYRVLVAMKMGPPPRPMPKIYRTPEASPLMVTVEEKEKNELKITMDPNAGPMIGGSAAGSIMSAAQDAVTNTRSQTPEE